MRDILYHLNVGAGAALAANRACTRKIFFGTLQEAYKEKISEAAFSQQLCYLRRSRLIQTRQVGDEMLIVLTDAGRRKALRYDIEKLEVKKPAKWDGLWHLVFADIPEKKKRARNALRHKLRQLGFVQINRSVWIFPYECEKEVAFVTGYFGVEQYVYYAIVQRISNEVVLRKKFNLK